MRTIIKLHIDPEFRDKIPKLTDEEYKQLEENILEDGEVYEPIVVWNDTILDGHNRWNIICDHWDILGDKYTVKQMDFPDKWAAFEWMYKKQLGRRNLTEEQKTVLIGKMYESRKKSVGEHNGNQYARLECHQNDDIPKHNRTAFEIASELGVGKATVERSEKYAQGIDALAEVSKEASDKVLEGRSGANKKTIMEFPKLEPERQQEIADAILSGTIRDAQKHTGTKIESGRAFMAKLREIDEELTNPNPDNYTLDDAIAEIQSIGDEMVCKLRKLFEVRKDVVSNHKRVKTAVKELATRINNLKEEI